MHASTCTSVLVTGAQWSATASWATNHYSTKDTFHLGTIHTAECWCQLPYRHQCLLPTVQSCENVVTLHCIVLTYFCRAHANCCQAWTSLDHVLVQIFATAVHCACDFAITLYTWAIGKCDPARIATAYGSTSPEKHYDGKSHPRKQRGIVWVILHTHTTGIFLRSHCRISVYTMWFISVGPPYCFFTGLRWEKESTSEWILYRSRCWVFWNAWNSTSSVRRTSSRSGCTFLSGSKQKIEKLFSYRAFGQNGNPENLVSWEFRQRCVLENSTESNTIDF